MILKRILLFFLLLSPTLLWARDFDLGPPIYKLDVAFDIPQAQIIGAAKLQVHAGQTLRLLTGELDVTQITVNGRIISFARRDGSVSLVSPANGEAEIRYTGFFKGGKTTGRGNYGVQASMIDRQGISLTGHWYPRLEGLAIYRLTATLPRGYEALSEAEQISRIEKEKGREFCFEFAHPLDSLSLVASDRYEVTEARVGDVTLAAYFFPEDRELASTYLRYAKSYLALYEKLLTKFPYKRFAIAENFLSTGYSLPTFTLLGRDVVRLPFIVETSLGHEILHQWFGNSVYSDYAQGNWAEGLTTYLADHLYEERKGKGWEYRKQQLVEYEAYVHAGNDFSLREFQGRVDEGSRAVGYGKGALVFHMLRKLMGEDKFHAALRDFVGRKQYQRATWDDLKQGFERQAGRDLTVFFRQWVDEGELPEIRLENVLLRRQAAKFEVSLDLIRNQGSQTLELPVAVLLRSGETHKEVITLDEAKKKIVIRTDDEPVRLLIDADYDVARRLTEAETPPVVAQLLGDERVIVVLPQKDRERYAVIVEAFRARGGEIREAAQLKERELRVASLVVLDQANAILSRLWGAVPETAVAGFSLVVKKNPWNGKKAVGVIHAADQEEAEAALPKIFHYGRYSQLAFARGKNIAKVAAVAERGIIAELRAEALAVAPSGLKTFAEIITEAASRQIVYVGENHESFSHHNIQLQVIQALKNDKRKLAIGMEMFQRPFQKILDDYLRGAVSERDFLKKTQYFQRWAYDYNLYKPLLDYAKAAKIPVLALNIEREITEKVAREGMDSLNEKERQGLPRQMDFSDTAYRERLRQFFAQHEGAQEKNFDNFLQVQILWDESMAQSVDDYLRGNPDTLMVVLAGNGHLLYGSGIPQRVFRRNVLPYAIILNDVEAQRNIADYIFLPPPLEGMMSPKLMVAIKEDNGRIAIASFMEESVAKKAGLKEGDVIVAADGQAVQGLHDLKLALFDKKKGDALRIAILRNDDAAGEKAMEFEVKL